MSHHDSHHGETEHGAETPKGGNTFLLLSGILVLVLAVVVAALLLTRSNSATEEEDADRAAVRIKNLAELQAADAATLNSYGWVNQAKGIVRIPIDRAISLTVKELNSRQPAAVSEPKTEVPAQPVPAVTAALTNSPTKQP